MQIEVRPTERLRGKNPVDLASVLGSIFSAVRESSLDLTRLRIACDWVQYRQNFRDAVSVRQIMPTPLHGAGSDFYELAVDLRRAQALEGLSEQVARVLNSVDNGATNGNQYLEDWQRGSQSVVWDFNGLYWNFLALWEEATGQEYEQALPGGESDARNTAMARELIEGLCSVWDMLAQNRALPEDLYILELGVGNGNQARAWLDEFVKVEHERRSDYYRRLHYLMADYSPHVLERARENVGVHSSRCSTLVMDARAPTQTLGFLRSRAFLIYISNVYDNLPTDEVVSIGGHLYLVEGRAYIPSEIAGEIAGNIGGTPEELPGLIRRLLQLGPVLLAQAYPERFPNGVMDVVSFWRRVWDTVRLEERYVALEGLELYQVAKGVRGEVLRPILTTTGDIRMHVSNGATASFLDSLSLLHPYGVLQCHDIFVTDPAEYERSFRGPGKYQGSVVNWVNGSLLAALARRNGYEAEFEPFAHRPESNIKTLSARVRE